MNNNDTSGFYLFDYNKMDVSYGRQAFEAIYESLQKSSGVCAFNDGDIFDATILKRLVSQANSVESAHDESPLRDNKNYNIGPYLISMYTDRNENFDMLHDFLVAKNVPGYQGYFTLPGSYKFEEFLQFVTRNLGLLSESIILRDGEVIRETSRYGVGLRVRSGRWKHVLFGIVLIGIIFVILWFLKSR